MGDDRGNDIGGYYHDDLTHRVVIDGTAEPRYWHEVETGARGGEWTSHGSGPPVSVVVTPKGIQIFGRGIKVERTLRPGEARWLAIRILEGLGVYEATFGGDGTQPRDGLPGRAPLVAEGGSNNEPRTGNTVWVCPCGRESKNRGAMSFHTAKCGRGPATAEER